MKAFTVIFLCCLHAAILLGVEPDAEGPKEHVIALGDANTVQAEFHTGASGKIAFGLKFADGKAQWILGVVKPEKLLRSVLKDGKRTPETTLAPDALIEFQGAGLRVENHIRPCLARYTEAQQTDLLARWDAMPSPSQSWVLLEVRADGAGAELWMEGRYCGRVAGEGRLAEVSFKLEEGGAVRGAKTFVRSDTGLFFTARRAAHRAAWRDEGCDGLAEAGDAASGDGAGDRRRWRGECGCRQREGDAGRTRAGDE